MSLIIGFLIGWITGMEVANALFGKADWYRAVPIFILFILWMISRFQ